MDETTEDALWAAHYDEIVRVFGAEAASTANIGWGVGETSICSKVYGLSGGFLTTYHDEAGNIEEHYAADQHGNPMGQED